MNPQLGRSQQLYDQALDRCRELSDRYAPLLREAASRGWPIPTLFPPFVPEGHTTYQLQVCVCELIYRPRLTARQLLRDANQTLRLTALALHTPESGYKYPPRLHLLENARPSAADNQWPLSEIRVFNGPKPTSYTYQDLRDVDRLKGPELASEDQLRVFLDAVGAGLFSSLTEELQRRSDSLAQALERSEQAL